MDLNSVSTEQAQGNGHTLCFVGDTHSFRGLQGAGLPVAHPELCLLALQCVNLVAVDPTLAAVDPTLA